MITPELMEANVFRIVLNGGGGLRWKIKNHDTFIIFRYYFRFKDLFNLF